MLIDLFSNKKFSNIISDNVDFLFPVNEETIDKLDSLDLNLFNTRNKLVNENARLKNEVIECDSKKNIKTIKSKKI